MIRLRILLLVLLASGCAAHPPTPVLYDLDSIRPVPVSSARLHTNIAIPPIGAPSWLRTPSLLYRLGYTAQPGPAPYTSSRWSAPPAELLTLRLRQAVSASNTGFTLRSLTRGTDGYRLDVTLEEFVQVFSSPRASRCFVTLSATLTGKAERLLAQRTFRGEQQAPSSDAAGAARGLVDASDACLEQILQWLEATLQGAASS
jgi:cholesterol transport system auxiliary component